MSFHPKLQKKIEQQSQRMDKASKERHTLAQLGYFGSIGLLMVVPIVGGAYLGQWLDEKLPGFSTSWTISLIVLGVFVGAFNVYLYIKSIEV